MFEASVYLDYFPRILLLYDYDGMLKKRRALICKSYIYVKMCTRICTVLEGGGIIDMVLIQYSKGCGFKLEFLAN